uniref:Uncharacterized protein n=1 Tax=Trichuris muris TaxID=70415 RepID=A0A5S6QAP9_TRIMR
MSSLKAEVLTKTGNSSSNNCSTKSVATISGTFAVCPHAAVTRIANDSLTKDSAEQQLLGDHLCMNKPEGSFRACHLNYTHASSGCMWRGKDGVSSLDSLPPKQICLLFLCSNDRKIDQLAIVACFSAEALPINMAVGADKEVQD